MVSPIMYLSLTLAIVGIFGTKWDGVDVFLNSLLISGAGYLKSNVFSSGFAYFDYY